MLLESLMVELLGCSIEPQPLVEGTVLVRTTLL